MTLKELVPLVKNDLIPKFAGMMFFRLHFDNCEAKASVCSEISNADDCFRLYQKVQSYVNWEKKYLHLVWHRHFLLKYKCKLELRRLGKIHVCNDTALKFCLYMLHTAAGLSKEQIDTALAEFPALERLPTFRVRELYPLNSENECRAFLQYLLQNYPSLKLAVEELEYEVARAFAAGYDVERNLSFLCRLKGENTPFLHRFLARREISERLSAHVSIQELLCWMIYMRAHTV